MTRTTSGLWLDLNMQGLAADRPNIPTPPPGVTATYYATDTGDISAFVAGAWYLIASTGGGVTTFAADSLTASTTQTQAGALQLSAKYNRVSVAAVSGDAVKLPAATVGAEVWVFNDGANPIKVFPQGAAEVIDAVAAAGSVTCSNAKGAMFACRAAGKWTSFGIAAHSA